MAYIVHFLWAFSLFHRRTSVACAWIFRVDRSLFDTLVPSVVIFQAGQPPQSPPRRAVFSNLVGTRTILTNAITVQGLDGTPVDTGAPPRGRGHARHSRGPRRAAILKTLIPAVRPARVEIAQWKGIAVLMNAAPVQVGPVGNPVETGNLVESPSGRPSRGRGAGLGTPVAILPSQMFPYRALKPRAVVIRLPSDATPANEACDAVDHRPRSNK